MWVQSPPANGYLAHQTDEAYVAALRPLYNSHENRQYPRVPTTGAYPAYDLEERLTNMMEDKFDKILAEIRLDNNHQRQQMNNRWKRDDWTHDGRPICHYCYRDGHIQRDCWKKARDESQRNQCSQGNSPMRVNRVKARKFKNSQCQKEDTKVIPVTRLV